MTWVKWEDGWESLHEGAAFRAICIKEFISDAQDRLSIFDIVFQPFHIYEGYYYGFLDDDDEIIFHDDDEPCMEIMHNESNIEIPMESAKEFFRLLEVEE